MGKIILIGTEHGDLKGSERLESLLETARPNVISVEFSLESLRLSKNDPDEVAEIISRMNKRGVSKPYVEWLTDFLSKHLSDFEYDTAKSYTKRHKIPLHLVDNPALAEAARDLKIQVLHRLFDSIPTDVESPLPKEEELVRDTDKNYEFALHALNKEIPQYQIDKFLDRYRGVLIGQRDTYMAQRMRQIAKDSPNFTLVHVCGFAHLFNDSKKETLYSKIKDLNPERHLIYCQEPTT